MWLRAHRDQNHDPTAAERESLRMRDELKAAPRTAPNSHLLVTVAVALSIAACHSVVGIFSESHEYLLDFSHRFPGGTPKSFL
jgi:hypothetical protein